jgi:hypothetical protein
MKDPVRWLEDESDLSREERRVMGADQALRAPPGAKAAVRSALSVTLAVAGTAAASGSAASTAAASGVTALSLIKVVGLGMALGASVSGAVYFGMPRPSAPVAQVLPAANPSAVTPNRATPVPRDAMGRVEAEPEQHAPEAASVAAPAAGHPAARRVDPGALDTASRSLEPSSPEPRESEGQRVARARALLRSGDAPRALDVLRALERDEPAGLLVQEREAMLIESLAATGQREAARQRAAVFLERYPSSPHAAAVRRATE